MAFSELFDLENNEKNKIESSTLYVVSTPIGNLSDLSFRAVKVLSSVDFIAAEDTRNTQKLLSFLGIKKPTVSYYEHNKRESGERICERLLGGESCAIVTDAGTPAISDPGEDLVRLCVGKGIKVTSVPGACAAINALTLSALPTARFCFEGFLPVEKKERRERLEALAREERTFVLHEAPHKLKNTLSDLCKALGEERKISLCREMTKLNEEIFRTTLGEACGYYEENDPRGEYVLVIEGGDKASVGTQAPDFSGLTVKEHIVKYVSDGMTKMEAVKRVAKERGLGKNEVYMESIDIKDIK